MDILNFLYKTAPGRIVLRPLISPCASRAAGFFLDSRASVLLIRPFVRKYRIDLTDFRKEKYHSFNDFFCRRIRPGARPFCSDPAALCAPCDGLLSLWPIREETVIPVKQSAFSAVSLLKSTEMARRFEGGTAFVFRLCVNHYHRYAYAESGLKARDRLVRGFFHTVRPVALESVPVFTENTRNISLTRTPGKGLVAQIEVGAMLVGKIQNDKPEKGWVKRGDEKGRFLYGGSTVILLVQKDRVRPAEEIRVELEKEPGKEIPVKMGQVIACETGII